MVTMISRALALGARMGRGVVTDGVRLGWCSICRRRSAFVQAGPSVREHRICVRCRASSRARAVLTTLDDVAPGWRTSEIYEPSPTGKASTAIAASCRGYSTSVYRPDQEFGSIVDGVRNEDLHALTIPSQSVDVVLTQDVLEHVFDPERVVAEIARVLRPGGVHVFTVPFHGDIQHTRVRARRASDGSVEHDLPPMYHDDPFDEAGALVTIDWGADLTLLVDGWGDTTTEVRYVSPTHEDETPVEVFISRLAREQTSLS